MTERPFLQKVGMQLAKLWTQTQIKHAVTTSANMSSLGGCEMRWMSRDEGSDRRSRILVCSSVMGVKDARMTSIKRERLGGVKISQGLMNALFSKTFQIYEHSPFRCERRGQEGGYIPVNLIVCFKYIFRRWHPYCLRVALCLHL